MKTSLPLALLLTLCAMVVACEDDPRDVDHGTADAGAGTGN